MNAELFTTELARVYEMIALDLIVRRFPPVSRLARLLGEGQQYAKHSNAQIQILVGTHQNRPPRPSKPNTINNYLSCGN
jgi:hypothetical protein